MNEKEKFQASKGHTINLISLAILVLIVISFLRKDDFIIQASANERPLFVKYYLFLGADVNATNRSGMTPLMMVSSNGNTELAELLINKGAEIGFTNQNGNTAIDIARDFNNQSLLPLLENSNR